MQTCFQIAAFARTQWAVAMLLTRRPGADALAEIKFKEAEDAAWAYGWGVSDVPSDLFIDVPELMAAFNAGQKALQQDMKYTFQKGLENG
ncbi:hypothetical protein [Pseudomonas abietaniphila]|uniref:hypothetical protein n=1 Tax=Pseudomonas abietaniphila TaxID=89065 RepID=UPI000943F154|nr:hypothetical protein [Pseudomonas abietaniphila]